MNKTKRKIFETSMKLFAEKGYEATSVEEITAKVGVAKGTLYYHFTSKEEIFNFLIEEGMKLLKNSIEIKISKSNNYIEKLKAIILIQIKVMAKYEDLMVIVLSQIWGNEPRNILCKNYVIEYIEMLQKIIQEAIDAGEIIRADASIMASEIFALTCSTLIYTRKEKKEIDVARLYKEYENTIIRQIKNS